MLPKPHSSVNSATDNAQNFSLAKNAKASHYSNNHQLSTAEATLRTENSNETSMIPHNRQYESTITNIKNNSISDLSSLSSIVTVQNNVGSAPNNVPSSAFKIIINQDVTSHSSSTYYSDNIIVTKSQYSESDLISSYQNSGEFQIIQETQKRKLDYSGDEIADKNKKMEEISKIQTDNLTYDEDNMCEKESEVDSNSDEEANFTGESMLLIL
jgi:hypothetical protein